MKSELVTEIEILSQYMGYKFVDFKTHLESNQPYMVYTRIKNAAEPKEIIAKRNLKRPYFYVCTIPYTDEMKELLVTHKLRSS